MGVNIPLPKITAANTAEQVQQLQSYIFKMAEQLNWALNTIETSNGTTTSSPTIKFEQREEITEKEAVDTFNSIKALIIKSADIVQAYEETFFTDFNGKYFADSDFGTYLEETSAVVKANSEGVSEYYTNIQTITNEDGTGSLDVLEKETLTTNAYIKRGLLGYDDNGNAIYGVEVGETNNDGAFHKYARFKSDRLSFFDANSEEVAYIGNGCLYILGTSRFVGTVYFGGYKADTSDGLAFTWIG